MILYYVVEHISYLPSDEYDFKNEIAIPSDEVDDRTYKTKSFKTEEDARKYVNEIRLKEGIYLANIEMFKVMKEKVEI